MTFRCGPLCQNTVGHDAQLPSDSSGYPTRSRFYYPAPLFYLALVLVMTGLLAPVFYWVADHWMHAPFSRYVNRALMVSALLALLPYFLKNWRLLGMGWHRTSRRDLLLGVGISLASVALVLLMHQLSGSRQWTGQLTLKTALGAVVAALLVSPLEELLFRGAIQRSLIVRLGAFAGWLVTGLFFASVHFIKVPRSFQPDPVTWLSGFHSLGLALAPLGRLETYGSAFFCLLVVGLILGWMAVRTRHLWLSIGLHAGWIVGLKCGSSLSEPTKRASDLIGGSDLLSGGLTLIMLALLGLALWRFYPSQPSAIGD
ncbi:MAG: hypothetical protein B9S32_15925 [Verrucomicrobia bacterium Tous-C9LFEB]|nr:MAG: hypothetical protein B9S32_15925 [Verrucomicrobia bacterium Tous-C9LFEB]